IGGPPAAPNPPRPRPPGWMRLGMVPPELAAVDCPAFTIFKIDGKSLDSTNTIPLAASAPVSQKNGPPFTPGIEIVSVRPGGCENALILGLGQACGPGHLLLGSHEGRVQVLFGHALPRKRRRHGGKGLCRRSPLSRHFRLRHWPLFNRPQRPAG